MITFGSVALLRPWWLVALPLLAILFFVTRRKTSDLAGWTRAVDPPLLAAMLRRAGDQAGRAKIDVIFCVAALTALALSGPALRRADADRFRNLDATLIALDLSINAANGAGLRQAATAAQLALDHANGRQLGLILYAGDAYLASPLTDDAAAIGALLFAVDGQTVPDLGERPDRALALARQILEEARIIGGDVILISPGGGLDGAAMRQASALAAEGHAVHTLFTPPGGEGEALAVAGRAALTDLASAGHGIAEDAARPSGVLDAISNRAIRRLGANFAGVLAWRDYGRLLLIAAALPLLFVFRRSAR